MNSNEKEVNLSKQDQEALKLLEAKTICTRMKGILQFSTPLLQQKNMPHMQIPKVSCLTYIVQIVIF